MLDFDTARFHVAHVEGIAEVDQFSGLGLIACAQLEAAEDCGLPSLSRPRLATAEGQIVNALRRKPYRFAVIRWLPAWRRIKCIREVIAVMLIVELQRRHDGMTAGVWGSQG